MPLFLSPGQLTVRSQFYQQMATMSEAGLGLPKALETLARSPLSRSLRHPIRRLIQGIESGESFADSAATIRGWLPVLDVALVRAGESSGRIDISFALLARYYDHRSRVSREIMGYLFYPVILVHAAAFLIPFPSLFLTGDVKSFLIQFFSPLVPLYLVCLLLVFLSQPRKSLHWRSLLEQLFRWIPLLGAGLRALALSRLCMALDSLLSAGVQVTDSWRIAGAACGSPAVQRTAEGMADRMEGGAMPSELISEARVFPEMFRSLYATGEVSGRIDSSLQHLQHHYEEEGFAKLHTFARWLPRLIYFAIVIYIANYIIQFYTGYFNQILDATDDF